MYCKFKWSVEYKIKISSSGFLRMKPVLNSATINIMDITINITYTTILTSSTILNYSSTINFTDNNSCNLTLLTDIVQQYNRNIQFAERCIADRFKRLAEMWTDASFHYSGAKQIITPDRYSLLISQGITKVKGQCLMGSMFFIVCSRFQVESQDWRVTQFVTNRKLQVLMH